jgi:small subunit ribosomal protein S1
MSEEIKKQETMDDFAQEIEASFSNFRDADMEIWDKLEQMKEDKEAFEVTIEGIVKGGAIAYVEGIRAFIPVSKLSLEYVKEPEEFLKKTLMVRVFEVDEAENRLVLSARELLKEQADAEKLAVGSVLEGTVESLQTYGAFIDLGDGISGLVHISQISQKRIKSPKAVLSVGDNVTVKVIKNEDGKLSLSMKALMEAPEEEEEEVIDYELPEAEEATTTLGSLFKNIKLD